MNRSFAALFFCGLVSACTGWSLVPAGDSHDAVARDYVQLVLALGEHASAYVDAYFGR